MKTKALIPLALAFFVLTSCKEKIDTSKEEVAIKAAIEGEIKASFDGDYEKWAPFFVHQPYLLWMQAWKEDYVIKKGWLDISSSTKAWLKPERKGSMIHKGNFDYTIKIYEDVAWASFKAKITKVSQGVSTDMEGMEVRFLEKHNGKWEIAYLGTIYPSTYLEGKEK